MAGTLVCDETREKHRWGHNKVYIRKFHRKGVKKDDSNISVPLQSSQPVATTTEDGISLQPPQSLSHIDGVSEGSSSQNQAEVTIINGVESVHGDEFDSVLVRFENQIKINVSAARSKSEIGKVKRKLVSELELVRRLVKKLESKELQLKEYSGVEEYSTLQVPVNEDVDKGRGPFMVNSEVGSVENCDVRPFPGLSVVVTKNNHTGFNELFEKDNRTPNGNPYYPNSKFDFGKERFPTQGNNKRFKPNWFGSGIQLTRAFKSCSNLLTRLVKHKNSWLFKAPVDVEGLNLHDYHTIIKHPMDLGTIRNKLTKKLYKSPSEFAEDVRLTFRNAMTYNPKGHDVHTIAEDFVKIFEEKWAIIEAEYSLDVIPDINRDMDLTTPTSRKMPTPLPLSIHPSSQMMDRSISMVAPGDSTMERLRPTPNPDHGQNMSPNKPKAKKTSVRDMTFDEKQNLGISLQSLPSEKLDAIIQIIKQHSSALSQHDDEIEVDIDSVDAETLWELDRFVSDYKKSLSKNTREDKISHQPIIETGPTAINPTHLVLEEPSEIREDAENVPASLQVDKQGNDEGKSSSSSSSSSDSGSSSSDSDSASSSASESNPGSPKT